MSILEDCVREDLNSSARRVMAVLQPLRLVIDNYPAGESEELDIPYHPQKAGAGQPHRPLWRRAVHRGG